MKRILSLAIITLFFASAEAQINRDKNETTTLKKVTQKGTEVKTQVIKKTDTENEILKVEGTKEQDQRSKVVSNRSTDQEVVVDDVSVDAANQAKRETLKEQYNAKLAASIAAQKERAAQEAEAKRQAQLKQQKQELEARRAALTKRPEGMARLRTE